MPEARDRLSRYEDVNELFSRQRRSNGGGIAILADEPSVGPETPFRWGATALTAGTERATGVAAQLGGGGGVARGSLGTPRIGLRRGRNIYRSPATVGRQNMTPVGSFRRGRSTTNSVLPAWYPRTRLGDTTTIMRAIERRRARLREIDNQEIQSPLPEERFVLDAPPSVSYTPSARFEPNISTLLDINCPSSLGKVPKILLDFANPKTEQWDCLTPQKKLLESIQKVEKAVMDELHRLKKTPSAKKEERQKKVRTLMSMR